MVLGTSAGDPGALGLSLFPSSSWLICPHVLCVLFLLLGLCLFPATSPSKFCPENGVSWLLFHLIIVLQLQIVLIPMGEPYWPMTDDHAGPCHGLLDSLSMDRP